MENQLTIQSTPASLSIDFEAARKAIEKRVEKYNMVVTADTVADAKKVATQLNKEAGELDDRRKAAIAEVSAPIKAGDDQIKSLIAIYKNSRQKIVDQVKVFEDETRDEAERLLAEFKVSEWDRLDVAKEFRRAAINDLVKLTAVTKTGNLTAGAKSEVSSRCQADKSLQDRTERRLMELENRSYRAGLKEPLTRDHVEHFLMSEDDDYEAGITRILDAEVARQERIENAERERTRKERERVEADKMAEAQRQAEDEAKAAQEPVSAPESVQPPAQDAPAPQAQPEAPPPAPKGKRSWRVHCRFDLVGIDPKFTKDQIERELRRVLETKADITTLREINAVPQEGES